jgi:hypothetical protein
VPDEFQQYKGLLGQQIAKLHLQQVKQCTIVDEEARVEGVDGRARLDILVRRADNPFSPVEVKFQEYNLERYGVAFEFVLNQLGNQDHAHALDRNNNRYQLTQPLLYIWFPPSGRIAEVPFYRNTEVILFETVLIELRANLGQQFVETIGNAVKNKVEEFFQDRNCALTDLQRQSLREIFPDHNF